MIKRLIEVAGKDGDRKIFGLLEFT